jgi:mitogen-activated protein kinase kinase 7
MAFNNNSQSGAKPVGKSQTFPKGAQLLSSNQYSPTMSQMLNQNQNYNTNNTSPTPFDQYSSSGHSSTNDLTNSLQSLQFQQQNSINSTKSNQSLNLLPNQYLQTSSHSTPNNNNIIQNVQNGAAPTLSSNAMNSSYNSQNSQNSQSSINSQLNFQNLQNTSFSSSNMPPSLSTAGSTGNLIRSQNMQSSTASLTELNSGIKQLSQGIKQLSSTTPNRANMKLNFGSKPLNFGATKPKIGGLTFNKQQSSVILNNSQQKPTNLGLNTKLNTSTFKRGHTRGHSWHAPTPSQKIESDLIELNKMKGVVNVPGLPSQTIQISDLHCTRNKSLIGKGTQGEVHKMKFVCKKTKQEKTVAVKKMIKNGVQEELKRILQDNKTSYSCRTFENIAKWFGVICEENNIWIIMEFCEFGDFKNVVDRFKLRTKILNSNKPQNQPQTLTRAIPEFVVSEFTRSVVKALHYLKQEHSIIHRDIRPSNILVDEHGVVKLCDFGISGNLQDSKVFTQAAGVTTYLAPERVNASCMDDNQGYDVRSDVFALGITIYEISAGIHPFEHCRSAMEVAMEITNKNPIKFPEILSTQFSSDFKGFLQKTLAKKVEERWRYNSMLQHAFLTKVQQLNESGSERKNTNRVKAWLFEVFDLKKSDDKVVMNVGMSQLCVNQGSILSTSNNNLTQTPSPTQFMATPSFQERRFTIQPTCSQPLVGTPPVPPRSKNSMDKLKNLQNGQNSQNGPIFSNVQNGLNPQNGHTGQHNNKQANNNQADTSNNSKNNASLSSSNTVISSKQDWAKFD